MQSKSDIDSNDSIYTTMATFWQRAFKLLMHIRHNIEGVLFYFLDFADRSIKRFKKKNVSFCKNPLVSRGKLYFVTSSQRPQGGAGV